MRISEKDIHSALGKTGKLPENDFLALLENYHSTKKNSFINEKHHLHKEIREKILPNLKIYLNKSLSEILRLVVKSDNFSLFEQFDDFWIRMSDEILHRTEHLTNDQIVTMVDAFSKPKLFCKKLFDKFEDVIKESKILFTVISYFLTNLACPI